MRDSKTEVSVIKLLDDELAEIVKFQPGENGLRRYRRVGAWLLKHQPRIASVLKDAIAGLEATTQIHSPEDWYRDPRKKPCLINDPRKQLSRRIDPFWNEKSK